MRSVYSASHTLTSRRIPGTRNILISDALELYSPPMTILERLATWKITGAISNSQYDAISAIVRKDRFSVFFELNALLYLGVLSLIGGTGWIIQVYASDFGNAAIVS